jgi:two-component system, OmpR family, phosphate regulon sensor histidine kinase PhoR
MRKKRRLIWHIYPSYLLLVLLSLGAVSWYATDSLHNFFFHRIQADLKAQGQLLKSEFTALLSPINAEAIDQLCKETGHNTATRITIILRDGTVVGDSNEIPKHMDNHGSRNEIRSALAGETGVSTRYSRTLQHNMMYVAQPLSLGKELIAVIRTAIPLTAAEDEIRSLQLKILLGGCLIALAASGVCLLISRRISRPIENMTAVAERYARGELQLRPETPDTVELARLATALNQMAVQLESRIETVINQRNEYEAVLSSMVEGVIAVDMAEHILSINAAAIKMMGYRNAPLKGRNILEAIRNRDVYQIVTDALAAGDYREKDILLRQEGERIIHMQCIPLCNAGNERIGTLIVLHDVTQIRNLDTVRREFVANVSHEIKTPLTTIKGFVETLLQGSVESAEEKEKFLGIIKRHTDRLEAIIKDLLSLARLEQQEIEEERNERSEKEPFECRRIKDVIDTALQVIKSKADEKNIALAVSCDPEIQAKMDGTLMEQAIVNLLDNAVNYSPTESRVNIVVSAGEKDLCIHIKDQGPGIPGQHLSRLFERFYRVDKARSRKLGGTGLGLAIVKHICQVHGGTVTVESEPGKGSTFTIRLPGDLIT